MQRVGLIGVGMMGHGIGKNIVTKGFPLTVMAHRNRGPVEDLVAKGAKEVKSPREIAANSDVVILVVTASPQVEETVFGDNGLLAGMHKGLVIADCSTAQPHSTLKVAEAIAAKGGRFVDTPMVRTPKEAEEGKLALMTGGDPATLAEIKPVLDCFSDLQIYAGPVGAAHKLKLINNFVALGNAAVAAEAFAAAAKAGVDLQALTDIVMSGGGNSVMFGRLSRVPLADDDTMAKFQIDTARKDLRYYTNLTENLPMTSFMAEAVHQTFVLASNQGYGERFVPRLVDALGQLNGVKVRRRRDPVDFDYSHRARALQARLGAFMAREVLPRDADWQRLAAAGTYPLEVIEPLKQKARAEGLWNLFLPGLRADEPGQGLSNLDYAPLAEIMGRVFWSSEVFNCSAPDTGNMELLHLFATAAQRERWLLPLLRGEIRSCFAMTEPEVASSDATNIRTAIRREGGELMISGRKWFITGALHPHCKIAIVMGVSQELAQAEPHRRQSLVLVPMETPGLKIVRNVPIMHHEAIEGHCELIFDDVRVPAENLLGEAGQGFALAQARLGPGRIHHCMRTIGQCEVALELMCERARNRRAFGKAIAEHANIQDWIALSRMETDQARLYVLRAADMIDRLGAKAARTEVSAIKVVAARLQTQVADRAMQVFGAMGLTPDTPLAWIWTWGRALRFIDGPDEVHLRNVARAELKKPMDSRQ